MAALTLHSIWIFIPHNINNSIKAFSLFNKVNKFECGFTCSASGLSEDTKWTSKYRYTGVGFCITLHKILKYNELDARCPADYIAVELTRDTFLIWKVLG